MILEITAIIISITILFLVYFARMKSVEGKTFLFSNSFLQKADDTLFGFVKFVFKLHSLLFHNISTFLAHIPHKAANIIHKISNAVAQKSSEWVERITHKTHKD